jgi:hypothetical protein
MRIEELKIFEGKNIRVVFDDELLEWHFSLVDVIEVLADSANPTDYLKKLRKRNPELNTYVGTNCPQVQMVTESGKRRKTLAANPEHLSYIVPFVSSPKEEQFKQWVDEITNPSDGDIVQLSDIEGVQGEILLYQPDETVRLEVLMENETVWLTQAQIIELFQTSKSNISEHITNIYEQGELVYEATVRNFRTVQKEGDRMVNRVLTYYNLDAIISVGFRVNAKRGIRFRQWANGVIKNYLLQGYAINQQLLRMEQRLDAKIDAQQSEILKIESTLADHQEKIDFFVRTNQPPVEGVLFEGQIFDAYKLVEALVKSAKREIILIDNYVDASIFDLLEKREQGVDATIYTEHVGQSLQHLQQLNQQQYRRRIEVKEYNNRFHDRFLILDDALYHFGASFKDLGKRLFAFELMGIDKSIILSQL